MNKTGARFPHLTTFTLFKRRWFDHLGWESEILEAANRIEG